MPQYQIPIAIQKKIESRLFHQLNDGPGLSPRPNNRDYSNDVNHFENAAKVVKMNTKQYYQKAA